MPGRVIEDAGTGTPFYIDLATTKPHNRTCNSMVAVLWIEPDILYSLHVHILPVSYYKPKYALRISRCLKGLFGTLKVKIGLCNTRVNLVSYKPIVVRVAP